MLASRKGERGEFLPAIGYIVLQWTCSRHSSGEIFSPNRSLLRLPQRDEGHWGALGDNTCRGNALQSSSDSQCGSDRNTLGFYDSTSFGAAAATYSLKISCARWIVDFFPSFIFLNSSHSSQKSTFSSENSFFRNSRNKVQPSERKGHCNLGIIKSSEN